MVGAGALARAYYPSPLTLPILEPGAPCAEAWFIQRLILYPIVGTRWNKPTDCGRGR